MTVTTARVAPTPEAPAPQEFSLVCGGPLFQLQRRARLADDTLGLVHRRIALAIAIMWAPLAVLSALQGDLTPPGRALPFLNDVGFQLRFLVVAPLLIYAELIVHRRMQPMIEQFRARGLIRPAQSGLYEDALNGAARLRNSVLVEVLLLVLVYVVGVVFTLRRYEAMGGDAWYSAGGARISLAGLWLVFVSLPLLQFLLLRWYFRLFIWAQFLWRVSRLDLNLQATHPDKAGGLAFLGLSLFAFIPLAAAHGVLVAGLLADRILYAGAKLTDFKPEVFGVLLVLVAIFAGPLCAFAPLLAHVKRIGLREYGALGQTYVTGFHAKWIAARPPDEPLLGTGDIQSLADLGNSFAGAQLMRVVPVSVQGLATFIVAFLAPMVPLLLTMMSPEKLVERMVGLVF